MAAELRIAIGRRVRQLRRKQQVSQEALAERADLHRNYVGSVERGERDIGLRAIAKLASALDMSLAEFFEPFRQRYKLR